MRQMTEMAMRQADGGVYKDKYKYQYRVGCSGGSKHRLFLSRWTNSLTIAKSSYQTHRSHHGGAYVCIFRNDNKTIMSSYV